MQHRVLQIQSGLTCKPVLKSYKSSKIDWSEPGAALRGTGFWQFGLDAAPAHQASLHWYSTVFVVSVWLGCHPNPNQSNSFKKCFPVLACVASMPRRSGQSNSSMVLAVFQVPCVASEPLRPRLQKIAGNLRLSTKIRWMCWSGNLAQGGFAKRVEVSRQGEGSYCIRLFVHRSRSVTSN